MSLGRCSLEYRTISCALDLFVLTRRQRQDKTKIDCQKENKHTGYAKIFSTPYTSFALKFISTGALKSSENTLEVGAVKQRERRRINGLPPLDTISIS